MNTIQNNPKNNKNNSPSTKSKYIAPESHKIAKFTANNQEDTSEFTSLQNLHLFTINYELNQSILL